jgi:hypothetical protein
VFKYIAHHALAKTLFLCRDGRKIAAVGVAWPLTVKELFRRNRVKQPQFDWKALPEPGNALLIGPVIGTRKYLVKLWRVALNRWPFIRRIFTYRRGRLVELHLRTMERFCS